MTGALLAREDRKLTEQATSGTKDHRDQGAGHMTAHVIRADARQLPLPDASVDLIVTSPPYFALRSYTDGGEHYEGQIGSEATPAAYIAALIACTREWMRVLKPSGSIFVNLGDKYALRDGQGGPQGKTGQRASRKQAATYTQQAARTYGAPPKSLLLLPERYRIACVDELGLTARAVIVWDKPNGMPESVTDRVRRSHEDWVHLTMGARYFAAVDEIRLEPSGYSRPGAIRATPPGQRRRAMTDTCNPLGALPGSVWEIPSEPLRVPDELGVDHFAAFPMEWPRRLIRGWSPSGICTECGEGRRPTSESRITADRGGRQFNPSSGNVGVLGKERVCHITGEVCACPDTSAPTRPAVVLDPFGGTGTTALVASALGRIGITVDRSADYCRIARWRTTDPAQRAKALGVEKPPTQLPGQAELFDLLAA